MRANHAKGNDGIGRTGTPDRQVKVEPAWRRDQPAGKRAAGILQAQTYGVGFATAVAGLGGETFLGRTALSGRRQEDLPVWPGNGHAS